MRLIRTIILRFLIDTDQPQSLHGVLQTVGGNDLHSFTDEGSLLMQLHHIIQAPDASPGQPEQDGNGFKDSHQA